MPSMKHRGAVIALSIVAVASVAVGVVRRLPRHQATLAHPVLSARATPKPPPLLSASAPSPLPEPKPERPPYLDTTAKTLLEQRSALFTNMSSFERAGEDGEFDLLETLEALDHSTGSTGTESAEKQVSRDQTLQQIDDAVQTLPARQREAFLMRYWEEMDVAETAAAMGQALRQAGTVL